MQLIPYLNFDGRCAEAFHFYHDCLGGTVEVATFGDSPMAGDVPAEWQDRVMHARLSVDGALLMGSDSPPGDHRTPSGIHVSVHPDTVADAERIFAALAEGGSVTMPFAETFWSPGFGMLVDRYGIPWMVNVARAA